MLRRTFLRFVEKVDIVVFVILDTTRRTDRDNNFEDGLYIDGPYMMRIFLVKG